MTEINKTESTESISPRSKKYFKYLLIVLTGVIIMDGYGTVLPPTILSAISNEFLSGYDVNMQNSILALTVSLTSGGMYFLFLNQYLADKIGRKKMLTICIFGMAFAALLMLLSTTYIMYVIAAFILSFFVSTDMWLLYINEESEPDKRARNSNIMLCGGIIGPVSMIVMRGIFITDVTTAGWRGVTIFPIIVGFILFIIILFKVKETSKYEVMKTTGIQKRPIKDDFISIFKMEGRRSYIGIVIMSMLIGLTLNWAALFEKYVADTGNVSQSQVSIILLIGFILSFITFIINGVFADKIGRKPLLYFWIFLLPISIAIWIFGALDAENAFFYVFIGFVISNLCNNGMWGIIRIVTIETLPTDRRGTGIGIRSLLGTVGVTIGLALNSIVILIVGLGMTYIIFSFAGYIILPVLFFLVSETKSVKLDELS